MTNVDIADWFRYLAQSRNDLPVELIQVLSVQPSEVENSALMPSVEHIRRVLGFGMFSASEESDPEQRWVELTERLDDSSYYAALMIPFLRQVVEWRPGFINENIPNDKLHLLVWSRRGMAELHGFESKRGFVAACEELAIQLVDLKGLLDGLRNPEDFAYWCRSLLNVSSKLLLYATYSSLSWGGIDDVHPG